ncbi:hypothetical protein OSTOST_06682, partial [Ostertagia ostertagi]
LDQYLSRKLNRGLNRNLNRGHNQGLNQDLNQDPSQDRSQELNQDLNQDLNRLELNQDLKQHRRKQNKQKHPSTRKCRNTKPYDRIQNFGRESFVLYHGMLQKAMQVVQNSQKHSKNSQRDLEQNLASLDQYLSRKLNRGLNRNLNRGHNQGLNQDLNQDPSQDRSQELNQDLNQDLNRLELNQDLKQHRRKQNKQKHPSTRKCRNTKPYDRIQNFGRESFVLYHGMLQKAMQQLTRPRQWWDKLHEKIVENSHLYCTSIVDDKHCRAKENRTYFYGSKCIDDTTNVTRIMPAAEQYFRSHTATPKSFDIDTYMQALYYAILTTGVGLTGILCSSSFRHQQGDSYRLFYGIVYSQCVREYTAVRVQLPTKKIRQVPNEKTRGHVKRPKRGSSFERCEIQA